MDQERKDFSNILTSMKTYTQIIYIVNTITTVAVIILAFLYFKNPWQRNDQPANYEEVEIEEENTENSSAGFNEEITNTEELINTNDNTNTTENSSTIPLEYVRLQNARRINHLPADEREAVIEECNVDGASSEFNPDQDETAENSNTKENTRKILITITLFEILKLFPSKFPYFLNQRNMLSSEIYDDRKKIVKRMREIADHIEKTHNDVLIADRVGTGVGITSGVLTIAGLIAAPFTGGISLGLTIAGTTTAVLGGATSAGANITDYFITKNSLSELKTELEEHQVKIAKVSKLYNDYFVTYVHQCRPILEEFSKLPKNDFVLMMRTAQEIVSNSIKGLRHPFVNAKTIENVVKPVAYQFLMQLQSLSLNLHPAQLHEMADSLSDIMQNISSLHALIRMFVKYSSPIESKTQPMIQTSLGFTARTASAAFGPMAAIGSELIDVSAAGTPLVSMAKTARSAIGVLAAAFIVVDIVRMVQICQETGKTPTVQQLRSKADSLEEEMSPSAN